ncbi:hypothetical protein RCO48_14700 [Peribacillus frigoritolerans]|nr:hypothetical protein [Peribacillus frigoritolerans]
MDTGNFARIGIYELVLALIIVIGSVAILFARSRLTSIIILGAIGYTISPIFRFAASTGFSLDSTSHRNDFGISVFALFLPPSVNGKQKGRTDDVQGE